MQPVRVDVDQLASLSHYVERLAGKLRATPLSQDGVFPSWQSNVVVVATVRARAAADRAALAARMSATAAKLGAAGMAYTRTDTDASVVMERQMV